MEKRTVLAVVLSTVVIIGFYLAQGIFFPKPPVPAQASGVPQEQPAASPAPSSAIAQGTQTADNSPAPVGSVGTPAAESVQSPVEEDIRAQPPVIIDTNLIRVVLSNTGGDIISYQLKEHKDRGDLVDMILSGSAEAHAFTVSFGSRDEFLAGRARPVDAYFRTRKISEYIVEFSRDFTTLQGGRFTLTKRYEFKPDDYMFELNIMLDGGYSVPGFDFHGAAYTLAFGPQIGPRFEKLDQRYEYRRYITYTGKLKT
jgi:YidC/Oxa1 family membrane protein insertase